MDNTRKNWTREETMLAFELYCIIPSGQDTITNEHILSLAKAIGRTPSSVKLKLQNFKSYDPSYISDGRVGLSHGSKLDKEVCNDFLHNWDSLILETAEIKKHFEIPQFETESYGAEMIIPIGGDKVRGRKERVGQVFFRRAVLSAYSGMCCITGISNSALLRASHIKPWSISNDINEKTNPQNGILLNALHDAAFDKGLLTISLNYKIMVSSQLMNQNESNRLFFERYNGQEISKPTRFLPARKFIEYHNDVVFKR